MEILVLEDATHDRSVEVNPVRARVCYDISDIPEAMNVGQ